MKDILYCERLFVFDSYRYKWVKNSGEDVSHEFHVGLEERVVGSVYLSCSRSIYYCSCM